MILCIYSKGYQPVNEMRYEAPETIEAAIALLVAKDERPRVFAGGTDLIVQLKAEMIEPGMLVDIKKIKEPSEIIITADEVQIGSAVSGAEIGENVELKSLFPGLVESVLLIGSDQVQGRATIGGNFCNASPAADSVPALIAANAKAVIAGPNGVRKVDVQDLLVKPGKTSLTTGEFIISFALPRPPKKTGEAYLRFTPRTEMDIAVVGAGVSVTLNPDGTCATARLALGAVAPTARLVNQASDILVGKKLEKSVLADLAVAASAACQPIDDKRGTIEFRTKIAGVLASRATKIAWERAEKN